MAMVEPVVLLTLMPFAMFMPRDVYTTVVNAGITMSNTVGSVLDAPLAIS